MAITQNEVLRISEPVEQMFADATSQLIINIARHFADNKDLPTYQWEIKKLSELDALTQESVEIIAANTGKSPEAIQKALTEAAGIELKGAEKALQAAAGRGLIQGANMSLEASPGVRTVVRNLTEQAVEDTNIVNTVMLNSTRQRYVNAVQYAAQEEARLIERLQSAKSLQELDAQLDITQRALNASTFSVAAGAEARTTALRRTIQQLAVQGITGYIDKGGHHWTPEAYINMDIRTTVHNAAIQAQKARSGEYGVSTFQISSHAGARPLCAPYQGKFYSWDGSSGVIEDLYGNKHPYQGINTTSYGQPAGIFGINCGHTPQTFIPGYSVARYEPTEDAEENARLYELTQQQRHYEREIRKAKTEALAYDAAGDKEAFSKTAQQIKARNAQYKAFCAENNLMQRLERTQVVGYNRSVSGKATAAASIRQNKSIAYRSGKDFAKGYGRLPNSITASTTQNKLQGYLLNSNHPVGKHKARVINSVLGYHYENWGTLSDKIFDTLQTSTVSKIVETKYGMRYTVPMRIEGEKGKSIVFNTVWQTDIGSNVPRLITVTFNKKTIKGGG